MAQLDLWNRIGRESQLCPLGNRSAAAVGPIGVLLEVALEGQGDGVGGGADEGALIPGGAAGDPTEVVDDGLGVDAGAEG